MPGAIQGGWGKGGTAEVSSRVLQRA